MTEKDFASSIEELIRLYHWRYCHFRPARTLYGWRTAISGHAGFVDYVAVRGTRPLYIELKDEKGRVTPDEQIWMDLLKATGKCEVYLFRPSQWDEIVEILRGD